MGSLLRWMGRRPSCPASPEEKGLVESGFGLLTEHLGLDSLLKAPVVQPVRAFFPDPYDASAEAAQRVFVRVCDYMGIEPGSVGLGFWQEEGKGEEVDVPGMLGDGRQTRGASGYYTCADGSDKVFVNAAELNDPEALVSTMAHELAHALLLGYCGMAHDVPHMEALTDLATIYLGMGIFTSNTLLRRHGWVEGNLEGWSISRKGYISPEMAGWALSLFAWCRGEKNPEWSRHLETDGKAYLKQGLRYLEQTGDTSFSPQPRSTEK